MPAATTTGPSVARGKQEDAAGAMPTASSHTTGERQLLADLEHLRAALGADALGGRLTVLHGDRFRTLHFFLGFTFHAIGFHTAPPFLFSNDMPFYSSCQ